MRFFTPREQYEDKQAISFFELLLFWKSRIDRKTFCLSVMLLWLVYLNGYLILYFCIENLGLLSFYWFIPFFWALLMVSIKRCHDLNHSGHILWWALLPVLGPFLICFTLFCRKGSSAPNRFGLRCHDLQKDYIKTPTFDGTLPVLINDITEQNPVQVKRVLRPKTVQDIIDLLQNTDERICIGGGRFSMGGHTASIDAVQIDMRELNQILHFSSFYKTIHVQAGIRWCDIQRVIDPFNLSIKIMQTYANFTVGASLSVNAHGRYIGQGPVVLSVLKIVLILAEGQVVMATPTQNSDLFYAAIGGYGGVGVIVEVELSLTDNTKILRTYKKMSVQAYGAYFQNEIITNRDLVFHNADIYPPHYTKINAVSWSNTQQDSSSSTRLQAIKSVHPFNRYFLWAISETPFGKWRREHLVDRALMWRKSVHWRNFEAGYDVAELMPIATKKSTWILQEYFIPVTRLDEFLPKMAAILKSYRVNALNISIRHALRDPGTLLAWAKTEVFALVLYYKQKLAPEAKQQSRLWTRELIDAALHCEGSYYLPYHIFATPAQFHAAYPRAKEFFALKTKLDPHYRFRNPLWDAYYQVSTSIEECTMSSEFKTMMQQPVYQDKLYAFLKHVFNLFPEQRLYQLIKTTTEQHLDDVAIYQQLQHSLKSIKPMLADLTYVLPALFKQKKIMVAQTLQLLGERRQFNGYLEIGSSGRYISRLRKKIKITGTTYLLQDKAPSYSLADLFEREGLSKFGTFIPLQDYAPLTEEIPDQSIDLLTCYIGLHHIPLAKLLPFIASIQRVLRPGGYFILRDHDCTDADMKTFVSFIHTVFNMGTNVSWQENQQEFRHFRSIAEWSEILNQQGFEERGERLLQEGDPSDNCLLLFIKK